MNTGYCRGSIELRLRPADVRRRFIYDNTALGFTALFLKAHMYTRLLPRTPLFGVYHVNVYYTGPAYSDRPGRAKKRLLVLIPTVNGRGSGAGAGAGACPGSGLRILIGGAQRARAAIASEFQELGERSASAPQVRMRRESNFKKSACECQIANERRARRLQFVSNCSARKKVKMVIFESQGQNAQ
eukprot:6196092-Pleurochrysis_carterae.AAC.5